MIGKTIDNYKIIKHIGTGGMGTVYLAEDIMLGRKIAVKMLHSELLFKKDILERFKTEAKTLAKLNHPNIAILYNLIESSGNYFMIMEYVDGDSLETILIENGALAADEAIDITIQALEGIQHAHQKRIIHRDLKPANLMLNQDGVVKVMDFGIARALGSARMTREGSVVGTLEYMAPEQIRGQEGDERSDIYAMGIVLYELLTGNVPYRSKSDYDLMTKKLTQKPPEIRSFWHEIPKSLEKVVMKAIKKDPNLRFQSVEQFKLALKECKTDLPSVISQKAVKKSIQDISVTNSKSKKHINLGFTKLFSNTKYFLNTLALVVLILIVGTVAYHLRQKRLKSKIMSDADKTEMSNKLLAMENETILDNETPASNLSTEPEIKLNLEDFNHDNSKKKKEKKKKHKEKTKTKEVEKTKTKEVDKNNSKQKDKENTENDKDKNIKKDKSDDENTNNSGSNTGKVDDNKKSDNNSGDKAKENRSKQKTNSEKPENKDKTQLQKKDKILNTYIRKNVSIIVVLPQEITSRDIEMEGRNLTLYVDSDYVENGIVIIPKGTEVHCVINEIKKGEGRKRGTIEIEAKYIKTPDGKQIPLKESVFRYVGQRGKNVVFKKGQKFKVITAKKTNLTVRY